MTSQRATEILRAALAIPAEQREAYIALRCGADANLRDQVHAALAAQLAATIQGEQPAPGSVVDEPQPASISRASASDDAPADHALPFRRLGRYRILRLLGEGGMGVVYLAQQEHPQRLVALKVIRGGALSPRALRRFELEAQVLGRLQHPGIAQVYEAGTAAETGSEEGSTRPLPFFAMEYVQGVPLTDYANNQHLDTRQRLELLARVCDAVQHAHQKGVVHRDLKPGNILVDADGEGGQPKVLDFGVARTLDSDGSGGSAIASMHTDAGQLLGTVPYMSPEQVNAAPGGGPGPGDTRDIDTRSDVYTLGVILFELLVGQLPHNVAASTVAEAVRAIAQDEATRLSSLDRSLRGDIETIARKALEKDRNRRYQSAGEFAEDIRRYLRNEPIAARPPSRSYQLRKFAQRNTGLVAGVVIAFVVLITGAAATSTLAIVARRNEVRAEQAASAAIAVTEFLQNMLASANPDGDDLDRSGGGSATGSIYVASAVTVREVLDRSSADIAALDTKPQVQVPMLSILARSYRSLGELDKAHRCAKLCAEKAAVFYGPDSYEAMGARSLLGGVLLEQNQLAEAEAIADATIKWLESHKGHPSAGEAELAKARSELARIYFEAGRPKDALPLAQQAFDDLTRVKGPTFSSTMQAGDVLSTIQSALGDFANAEKVVRQNLAARESVYGKDSTSAAYTMTTLANALQRQSGGSGPKNDEALGLLKRVLDIRRAALAPDHPRLQLTIVNLAVAYVGAGRQAEALPLLREAFEANKARLGESHPRTLSAMGNLAYCLEDLGMLEEAERYYRRSVELGREELAHQDRSADTNDFSMRLSNLGSLLLKAGGPKIPEAEALFTEAWERSAKQLPEDHYYLALYKGNRGRALTRMGHFAAAEPLLLQSHAKLEKQFGNAKPGGAGSHPRVNKSAWRLAELYDAWGKPEQAKPWRDLIPEGYKDDR